MSALLVDLQSVFEGLTSMAATALMLCMVIDNQRPHGFARGVWRVAWALLSITAVLTLCLFALWCLERA